MEANSSAHHQSRMDLESPAVEEDIHMEDAAAAFSPAMQKMSRVEPDVSPFSTGNCQEAYFPVCDDQTFAFPPDIKQDSHFQVKDEECSHFTPQRTQAGQFQSVDSQSPQFLTPDGQETSFSAQDAEACPFITRTDLVSDIPAGGDVGSQFSAGTDAVPHSPVEHQTSEFGPEDERKSRLSESQLCSLPSEGHQALHWEPESGQGSQLPGRSDQSSHLRLYCDPCGQHQDEQGSHPTHQASDFHSSEDHQRAHFTAQEAFSSSQFPSTDVSSSHSVSESGAESNVLSANDEGTHFPAESAFISQLKTEDENGTCPFSVEQDPGSLDHVEKENDVHPTSDSSRKRKLAVFAAAGAVIAIQTMLVAMPEIWQPLEDDDSAEKVAYQEGLHSWFGALNRAAWLLSTANGAGDGGWWVKPRPSVWFNTYLMSSNEDDRWLAAIRMKRRTFLWICNSLEVHVRKQDTRLRPSIPVTVRVGATIYRLVNGVAYYEVADKFGVGESSVHEIMQDCVPAIVRVFGHHLRWPTGEAMAQVSRAFVEKCGLPNCQGALGSTHVEILNPSGPEARKYINRTGHFSIVLQAVADTSLSFLDVFCGFPERTYENKVLRNSGLYMRALAGEILAGPIERINGGFQLRPYVLGGSNYPLLPWLMVPYAPSSSTSYSQEQLIHHHEQGKIVTQQAFAILKRVFRVLGVGIRGRLELAPTIVQACCLLHNILIRRKELDVEAELASIGEISHTEDVEEGSLEPGDVSSLEIRNQLSEYLVRVS